MVASAPKERQVKGQNYTAENKNMRKVDEDHQLFSVFSSTVKDHHMEVEPGQNQAKEHQW